MRQASGCPGWGSKPVVPRQFVMVAGDEGSCLVAGWEECPSFQFMFPRQSEQVVDPPFLARFWPGEAARCVTRHGGECMFRSQNPYGDAMSPKTPNDAQRSVVATED